VSFPHAFAYNPQTSSLAVVTADSQIRLVEGATEVKQLQGHNPNNIQGGQHTVAINAAGTRLAYTGNENTLQVWDLTTGSVNEIVMPIEGGSFVGSDTAFSPDGTLLVVAGGIEMLNKGETQIYDVATGNLLARIPVFARQIQFAGNQAIHLFTADPANNWYLYGVR
jgi:WD40 repeat protein